MARITAVEPGLQLGQW